MNKSLLSIIIPTCNDQQELIETIRSIRETADTAPEIVVVDDLSEPRSEIPSNLTDNLVYIRNVKRMGVGGSRHVGAERSSGDYLLFIDSHMRCEPGWYEKAMERITLPGRERTVHNGSCVQLGYGTMEMMFSPAQREFGKLEIDRPCSVHGRLGVKRSESKFEYECHKAEEKTVIQIDMRPDEPAMIPVTPTYCSARFNFWEPNERAVFSGHWAGEVKDDDEVSCIMGAIYFVPRKFFFEIGGLKSLRAWGEDEPFLSLKAWLAGGECRMMKKVRIGHKFREAVPYSLPPAEVVYNKVRAILETCNGDSEFLISKIDQGENFKSALEMIRMDMPIIEAERNRLSQIFDRYKRDVSWFCEKFKIPQPKESALAPSVLKSEFDRVCSEVSDINEHLEYLSRLASTCNHVTEFGVRYGTSTLALMYGRPSNLVSYDIGPMSGEGRFIEYGQSVGTDFRFVLGSSLEVVIDQTDMLLIDTQHNYDTLKLELERHHVKVARYIAMHDTARTTFGDSGDDGRHPGLWQAISEFLKTHREWELFSHHNHNNGLTVLRRNQ